MKVDFITLHCIKNYGSALQTYAMQKTINKIGAESETIDYIRKDAQDKNILNTRLNNSKFFNKNKLLRIAGKIMIKKSIIKQNKVFNNFLYSKINFSPKYLTNDEIVKNPPQADVYCTGSDQVWNSVWNNGIDKAYFLNFVPKGKKKISYASSFGKTELNEEEKEEMYKLLKEYEKISVREKSAVEILENLGLKGTLVLDPTLLLNKEEWQELIKTNQKLNKKKQKKDYILVYQLNSDNKEFDNYVKNLAKSKKMQVIRISNVIYQKYKYGKFIYCPTIEEFLKFFLDAKYIVTDSFHATAFAINFNKKFLDIYPKKFSTRLQNILELTGLTDRKLTNYNDLRSIDKEINYEHVNKIIKSERKKSIEFLKNEIFE